MASSIASPAPMSPSTPHPPPKSSHPAPTHILHPPTPPHSSPSSPSSTHSSSSAIFERDIEPLSLSTLPAPRDHTLAAFVPSVLDEAIEALTAAGETGDVDVEIELAGAGQPGTAEESMDGSSFRRSPSPPGIPAASSLAAARPALQERQSTTPFIPGGFNPAPTVATPTGLTTPPSPGSPRKQLDAPLPSLTVLPTTPTSSSTPIAPLPVAATARTLPPTHASTAKRLSFISYSDLLLSSPITSLPLSQALSPASPPPHLSALAAGGPAMVGERDRSREQSSYGDEGGEWEREGLGRGLEERLEEVLKGRGGEGKA